MAQLKIKAERFVSKKWWWYWSCIDCEMQVFMYHGHEEACKGLEIHWREKHG